MEEMTMTAEEIEQINNTLAGMTDDSVEDDPFAGKKEEPKVEVKTELTAEEKLDRIEKNYAKLLESHRRLQSENEKLKAENLKLKTGRTYPLKPISPVAPKPAVAKSQPTERVDLTAQVMLKLPDLDGADKPNDMGTCPTHGQVRSNKWKKCSKCGNDAAKQAWADNYANR